MADTMFSGLGVRLVSAVILIPPVLAAVYFGTPWFEILIALGVLLMAWEWFQLVGQRLSWLFLGMFYLVLPAWFLVILRNDPALGAKAVYWLLFVVWAADTGGYLVGSAIGGPKLVPAISPNKTWAGLIGALLGGALVGFGVAAVWNPPATSTLIAFSAFLAFVGQLGDLLESAVKRRFGVKDSGRLIPGHGGILDRVDGLLAVALVAGLIHMGGGGSGWFQ